MLLHLLFCVSHKDIINMFIDLFISVTRHFKPFFFSDSFYRFQHFFQCNERKLLYFGAIFQKLLTNSFICSKGKTFENI